MQKQTNKQKTGNRWEQGLGCWWNGLQPSQQWFTFPSHPFCIFNFWVSLVFQPFLSGMLP